MILLSPMIVLLCVGMHFVHAFDEGVLDSILQQSFRAGPIQMDLVHHVTSYLELSVDTLPQIQTLKAVNHDWTFNEVDPVPLEHRHRVRCGR